MVWQRYKNPLFTKGCVWIALVCFGVIPLWVEPAFSQDSRQSLPVINAEALNQLVAELQSAPPPALEIREGTELDDLQTAIGSGDISQLNPPGHVSDSAENDFSDVVGVSPRRTKSNKQAATKYPGSEEANDVLDITGLSAIEAAYSRRASQRLVQFGYDIFTGADARAPAPATLGDNYTLGPGDRVLVVLRGAQTKTQTYPVGDDGKLIVDSIRPITAAGRTLKDVSREIEQEISGSLMDTQAFVSLAKLRAVNVQVVGEVARPGRQSLSSYGGVIDALNAAGGIRKTGSLRRLQLARSDGTQQTLDLYQLLLTGSRDVDVQLKDGDRIMVPPVGGTMAVAGNIKRAAIYELPEKNPDVTLQQALYLAGETHLPAGLRFMRIRTDNAGNEQFTSLADPEAALLMDQDVILAQARGDAPRRVVSVMGNVRAPGRVPLDEARTLSALLGDGANIGDDTYPLMGIIERKNTRTLEKEYVPFRPADVLSGDNTPLREGDKVKLFSEKDVDHLTATPVAAGSSKAAMFDSGAGLDAAKENLSPTQRIVQDHVVTLRGAVARPGNYPIAKDTSLSEIIGAAGGLTREADKSSIEVVGYRTDDMGRREPVRDSYDITRENPRAILIPVGASVRINPKTDLVQREGVRISGEVARPGKYDIMRGEKLSSLLGRAGGVTREAYPAGTVFMRASARRQEAAQFKSAAQQLETSLARALSNEDKKPNSEQVDMARQLANELRNAPAVGRITVEADPDVLRLKPELDVLLEAGDEIVIPPRRQTVTVAGEVHAPANLQFISGKDAGKYLREGGGFTRFADESHAFVILPNGASRPLSVSAWNHEETAIAPGSTIVVPRDPDNYDTLQLVSGIGNILSQLAVSTAAIASINDKDD
ncbi:MAG TPA: SLBB domain-containing protein [Alphaproteobacteria bacterium]|nr:hypothetical protein [Rhodospirillaceae bacterium]HRJ11701.1 SLBB domain-containing protein [Alphaproteobacteria bacterium]